MMTEMFSADSTGHDDDGDTALVPDPGNPDAVLSALDRYNVVWHTADTSDRGAMPLGNGEVGISLWVEQDGDLQFYLARSDAQTELDRNVKLGKVRLALEPNPFTRGAPFRQELRLRAGCAEVVAGPPGQEARLRIFVDAEHPTVYVSGEFATPTSVTATLQTWRTSPRTMGDDCCLSGHSEATIVESADVVQGQPEGVLFYHRNGETCIRLLAEQQGLAAHLDTIPDTLTQRIFGGWMTLRGAGPGQGGTLSTSRPTTSLDVRITTDSTQTPDLVAWIAALQDSHRSAPAASTAAARTAAWWTAYWLQSWIFVDDRDFTNIAPPLDEAATPSLITRSYVLTRWMFACAGNGTFPIRYNGALFNLMPGGGEHYTLDNFATTYSAAPAGEPTLAINPDERSWGHNNLYQNIRLPYLSMLARGEATSLRPLFRFYRRFWALNRARASLYHNAEGQHSTEIAQTFGLLPGGVYGYDRRDLPLGYCVNRWGGAVDVSPGLELIDLMLDYYDFTGDTTFLTDELLPYARDLLRYVETRFRERHAGKMVIAPLQSVETYFDTTNPMPTVAGLQAVLERILALPAHLVSAGDRACFAHMREICPDLPREEVDRMQVLAPAEPNYGERHNVETPALYAIFPFRLYGLGKPDLPLAIASYQRALTQADSFRPFVVGQPLTTGNIASYSGWQQTGMEAALLGLTADAQTVLRENCTLQNPGARFPAMWGPIYDAVPDVDHGANILTTLQLMVLQVAGDGIVVLPAWPSEWAVSFKLHAPGGTIIAGRYRHGRVERLDVIPGARQADVRIGLGREEPPAPDKASS